MEVLSGRVLLRPSDAARSRAFYADVLGLAVYREFGPPGYPDVVFFLGNGPLEVSRHSADPPRGLALWLQVRIVAAEHARLASASVKVTRPPRREPWGLIEMWIEDPDGVRYRPCRGAGRPSTPPRPTLNGRLRHQLNH